MLFRTIVGRSSLACRPTYSVKWAKNLSPTPCAGDPTLVVSPRKACGVGLPWEAGGFPRRPKRAVQRSTLLSCTTVARRAANRRPTHPDVLLGESSPGSDRVPRAWTPSPYATVFGRRPTRPFVMTGRQRGCSG